MPSTNSGYYKRDALITCLYCFTLDLNNNFFFYTTGSCVWVLLLWGSHRAVESHRPRVTHRLHLLGTFLELALKVLCPNKPSFSRQTWMTDHSVTGLSFGIWGERIEWWESFQCPPKALNSNADRVLSLSVPLGYQKMFLMMELRKLFSPNIWLNRMLASPSRKFPWLQIMGISLCAYLNVFLPVWRKLHSDF